MLEQPKEIKDAAKATIAYARDPKLFSHMAGPEQAKALREFVADAIGRCVAPLIARERVAALLNASTRLFGECEQEGDDVYVVNNILTKLEEYADEITAYEEARAGGGE